MLFNSMEFILFLPCVLIIYFVLPHKFRWVLLLASSYYFYMAWKPEYIILIVVSTLVDYFASILMEKQQEKRKRKLLLFFSLFTNLGLLFVFKYFNFFNQEFGNIYRLLTHESYSNEGLNLLLPMGISFYTFQTLSYTIDVYRGKRKAERHLGYFALYVTYFPQLVAGPIERSERLIPQLKRKNIFDYDKFTFGLKLIVLGFFKKCVIADNISPIVDKVYGNVGGYDSISLLLSTILFSIQIYCDFSGYSDIAIGSSKLMGIDLMQNFRRPYFAKNLKDFWTRWHISLSQWFRDYVYISLGGNRISISRTYINLIITFLISGFWHGANWTFLIWGGIHGIYQLCGNLTNKSRNAIWKMLGLHDSSIKKIVNVLITYILVCVAWVFFRAQSISDAFYILGNIVKFNSFTSINLDQFFGQTYIMMVIMLSITMLFVYEFFEERFVTDSLVLESYKLNTIFRQTIYVLIICYIIFAGNFGHQEFIYFQF